jgi:hypothetical protein
MARRLPRDAIGAGYATRDFVDITTRGITLKAVAILVLAVVGLYAIQGRTPLELLAWALIVLIFGGAVLVVVKLLGLVIPGSGRPRS